MMEKRNIIEPGRTPSDGSKQAEDIEEIVKSGELNFKVMCTNVPNNAGKVPQSQEKPDEIQDKR